MEAGILPGRFSEEPAACGADKAEVSVTFRGVPALGWQTQDTATCTLVGGVAFVTEQAAGW